MAKKTENSNIWAVIEVMEPSKCLKGKWFSITGHLGLARPEVVRIIQDCGGEFTETPQRGGYLVTNRDWNKGTTAQPKASLKLMKALREGVKIITEDELVKMIVDGDTAAREKEAASR